MCACVCTSTYSWYIGLLLHTTMHENINNISTNVIILNVHHKLYEHYKTQCKTKLKGVFWASNVCMDLLSWSKALFCWCLIKHVFCEMKERSDNRGSLWFPSELQSHPHSLVFTSHFLSSGFALAPNSFRFSLFLFASFSSASPLFSFNTFF